ncbi:YkgJ family cysteine cluster protein [Desulfococcaceae bacterium OttesenSCG-928-F15]|nr:YkgJ family cysteine cluster protein [Desulfococcaceae bacterium OttesenSCG-928-F15]
MNPLFQNYEKLLVKLDESLAAIREKAGSAMVCQKGCEACCRSISIFSVEAFFLGDFLKALPKEERGFIFTQVSEKKGDESCPLLFEGICLAYDARPVICRTHGFPLVIRGDGEDFLDYCPMNFQGKKDLALSLSLQLETLNRTLSAIQGVFMRESGLSGEIPERFSVRDAVLRAL